MNRNPSYSLVELAFKNKELNKLFLGIKPYVYIPKFSYASGNIDLNTVIPDGIFPYIDQNSRSENTIYLNKTLNYLSMECDGLMPVASFIICSILHKKNHGVFPTEIDIDQLAQNLKETINNNEDFLKHDFADVGFGEEEGKYGYFKKLSFIVQKHGGPNFFPEKNNENESVKI